MGGGGGKLKEHHVPLLGGRGERGQGGGALLGPAYPPLNPEVDLGGGGGSSLRGHVDHVPLSGGTGKGGGALLGPAHPPF